MPGKHAQRSLPEDRRVIPENSSSGKHAERKAVSNVPIPVSNVADEMNGGK